MSADRCADDIPACRLWSESRKVLEYDELVFHLCFNRMKSDVHLHFHYNKPAATDGIIRLVPRQSGTLFPRLTFANLLLGAPESLSSLREFLIDQSLSEELLCNCTVV